MSPEEDMSVFSSGMSTASYSHPTGWRIPGFGKYLRIAAAVQDKLRSLGFRATNFLPTNDEAGDARLVVGLKQAEYDGVAIGGYFNQKSTFFVSLCFQVMALPHATKGKQP
jgi:hypothetical protein